ncbi:MAG TPA: class I SAM-dependent methyltransferase [Anaerolineae bacterium]|jgi:SAM-dependent methyltransferase|nr:class I SAM-dependent methyltransferase [Anaerolineae bacterium]
MIKKGLLRLLGALLVIDGILLLIFGRKYVRRWRAGSVKSIYYKVMDWLANRPSWILRVAGVIETGLGLTVLRRAPVELRSLYRVASRSYDAAAPIWRDWLFRDAYVALDKALSTYVRPGTSVLDLGCGTGANLERLLCRGLSFGLYTGVDLSEDMLAVANKKFGHVPNTRYYQLDLLTDPLPEGNFDLIVSTWVFEHLPNPLKVVNKAWERLQPEGHVILLFEAKSKSWQSRVVDWVWGFFSARLTREDEYDRFPGIISTEIFPTAGAPAVLIILQKLESAT